MGITGEIYDKNSNFIKVDHVLLLLFFQWLHTFREKIPVEKSTFVTRPGNSTVAYGILDLDTATSVAEEAEAPSFPPPTQFSCHFE